jgi:outer membrane protein assembly factor BamB
LNSANGRTLWRYTAKHKPVLDADFGTDLYALTKNAVIVRLSDALVSLDLNNGKQLWSFAMEPTGSLKVLGDIVLAHEISTGAMTTQPVVAVDVKSGKLKWRLNGSFGPLLESNGNKLYFENIWPRNDLSKYEFKLDIYDASTGKKLESKEYLPLTVGADPLVIQAQQVAMNGFFLYIQADSGAVYKYDVREAVPATAKPMLEKADWLAGPYDGKLFLRTEHSAGLRSVVAEDFSEQVFEGLDNSVNFLRLNQSAAIVGQTDGELYVVNFVTGKSIFRYQTGASMVRSVTISGNTLLVETEEQLTLFDLPSELQKAPVAPTLANSLKKADVSLLLNSKKITLSAPVMTHKNEYFLPAKELLERMGGALTFDNVNETYRFLYGDRIVSFNSGQTKATVNEKTESLQFEAVDVKSVLYLSAKDFERLTGASVIADSNVRTISVQTKTTVK